MGKQELRALEFMRTNGYISRGEAISQCGVANLTAVISTLRKRGYAIGGRSVDHINKFGEQVHRHEYFLQEASKNV